MAGYREDAPDAGLYGHKTNMEEYCQNMRFMWGYADGIRHEKKSADFPSKLSDPVSPSYEAGYYAGRECCQDGRTYEDTSETAYAIYMKRNSQ